MSADLDSAAPAPRLWSWKKLLFGLLGVLAALVIFLLAWDAKLEPYEDLIPEPVVVPDATTNGYLCLRDRWKNLPEPDTGDQELLDQMLRGELPWNSVLAARSRRGRENLAADLKTALALPAYMAPQVLSVADLRTVETHTLLRFARPLALEARVLVRAGEMDAALEALQALHQLSVREIAASQTSSDLFVTIALQGLAAELTCDILNEGKPTEAQAARMAAIWNTEPLVSAVWKRTLQTEAAVFRDMVEEMKSDPATLRSRWIGLFIKPHQTVNRANRHLRVLRDIGFKPYPTWEAAQADGWGRQDREHQGVSRFLDLNYFGKTFADGTRNSSAGFAVEQISHKGYFKPRALQARLAFFRWRLAQPDQWPATLEELVPDYLPAVPLDPWNGQPLVWDAATLTISAVGCDWKARPPTFDRRAKWFSNEAADPGLRLELPPPAPPPVSTPSRKPPPNPAIRTAP